MAVTIQNSSQYAKASAVPPTLNAVTDWHGRVRKYFFDFTQSAAGDAGSLVYAVKIPAGKIRLYLPASRIYFSAMGTARTLDIGWLAYNTPDGTVVAADPNGLDDNVDVSSAGSVNPGGTIGTHETKLFDSREGVTLTLQVNDGTLPDAATFSGYFELVDD